MSLGSTSLLLPFKTYGTTVGVGTALSVGTHGVGQAYTGVQ